MRYPTVNSRLPNLLLPSCNPSPHVQLRIGSNNSASYQPFYPLYSLGYYQNNPVKPPQLTPTPEARQTLHHGNLKNAVLTLYKAVTLTEDNYGLPVTHPIGFSIGENTSLTQATESQPLFMLKIGFLQKPIKAHHLVNLNFLPGHKQ